MLLKNTFEIQLMKQDNDGNDLKPLNENIKMKASETFGGCTLLPSKGYWVDGGTLFLDDSYRMVVSFNHEQGTLDKLLDLIKMELIGGQQEAVCFTINGTTSISSSMLEVQNDLNAMFYTNSKKTIDKIAR